MRARDVIPLYGDRQMVRTAQINKSEASKRETHTRRSAPELFSAAQSSGLWPGARATFSRFLGLDNCVGGFVVVGGGIREDAADGAGGPGIRGGGMDGGGGIRDDREVHCDEDADDAGAIR
jgi:hypothetical protein